MANKVSINKVAKALASTSNATIFDEVIKNSPKFASYLPAGTQDRITEAGVEAISKIPDAVNEFYQTLMRVVFEKVDVARARNRFQDIGLLEEWPQPYGEYAQRYAVEAVTPISPQFRNLQNGQSVDQFVVRKPSIKERFFKLNYDTQNLISLQQYNLKRILLEEGQIGAVSAGILQGMDTGRVIQENLLVKYLINKILNSEDHPLRESQQYTVDWADDIDSVTDDQFKNFLIAISDIFGSMFALDTPVTGAFNAAGYKTTVERDQYVMIARTGIKNRINKRLMAGAFNPSYLNLDIDQVYDINDFGNLKPYADAAYGTQLYPVFNPLGDKSGYFISEANGAAEVTNGNLKLSEVSEDGGATTKIGYVLAKYDVKASSLTGAVSEDNVFWKDGNADVLAMIIQRGAMGIHRQNGYDMATVPNYAGLYNNYWASSPNNGLYTDYYYNVIVIRRATGA